MLNNIWDAFLNIIRQEAGSRVVDTWLKAVSLIRWDSLNKTVYLQAPNSFVKDWINSHYTELFSLHLKRLFNVDHVNIVFVDSRQIVEVPESKAIIQDAVTIKPAVRDYTQEQLASEKLPVRSNVTRERTKISFKDRGYLNTNYRFNTFVVGPNNSLAYAAAYAITQKLGVLYNPLFIYGGSGLGKTHLLHAIGNEIKSNYKNIVVLYQTADRFVNEFINAIRFDKVYLFKEKYKDVDVLLIDDIQFFSNKDQTQEAFFHIFNSLYDARKQIVFTSDSYPKAIDGLAERLRSRLEWGLITDICSPTLETKIAILKKKAEMGNDIVPEEVFHYIASRVESNIRELEGTLIRILAFANLTNQKISLELAKKVLGNSLSKKQNGAVNINNIVKCVSKKYSINLSELQSKSRNKDLSFSRQVCMYLMKQMTDKSLQDIGYFFKRKDHSTVLHAVNKINKLLEVDQQFSEEIKKMQQEITNQ